MNVYFLLIAGVAILFFLYQKNKEVMKQLSFAQIVGVLLAYSLSIALILLAIVYVGFPLTESISNSIVQLILRFLFVIMVLFTVMFFLEKTARKITNGVFPQRNEEE